MTTLANRLAEVGRRAEVLAAAQEAMNLYQELARIDHDVFGLAAEQAEDLVTALSNDPS